MQSLNTAGDRLRPLVPIILRLTLGVIFFWHGVDKFRTGLGNVENAFDGWGIPAPGLTAPFSAVLEIVAGAALILGLATRAAAASLAGLIVGALVFVKLEDGLLGSAELDLALLAGLVSLVALGPGRLSADHQLGLDADTTTRFDADARVSVGA